MKPTTEDSCLAYHHPRPDELREFLPVKKVDRKNQYDLHLVRIATLNPQFAKCLDDLDKMDDATKQQLIDDINELRQNHE